MNAVDLSEDSEPVHIGSQGSQVVMWANVSPKATVRRRYFQVVGTGQPFPDDARYIGTVQIGELVWHVLERLDVLNVELSP